MARFLAFAVGFLVGYALYEMLRSEPQQTYRDDRPYVLPVDERFIDLWAEGFHARTT